ncbi:hypothetical protein H4582DRAFT_2055158 [Lactarius indigo]|nr:hypothetical protein H4582DRAFT_2055158 [Lactarius indigo]
MTCGLPLRTWPFGGRNDINYINVYTTDKCPTYQLHQGIWRRRRCKELFPKMLEKLVDQLEKMSETYKACAGSMGQKPQEGCARLEFRVPLVLAQDALRSTSNIFAWVQYILHWTECAPSLTLGAILIYMLNAINYRPAEASHYSKELLCEWEEVTVLPWIPFAWLYGIADEQDFNIRFNVKSWHGNSQERNKNRIQNRRKHPVDIRHVVADEELKAQDRTLSDQGIAMMPLPQEADQTDEGQGGSESIDDIIARIWRQFPYDLLENAPNRSGKEATTKIFKNTDLWRLFSRVVVKVVSPKDWENLQFRRFFPSKGFVPPTRFQNFPYMLYFQLWNTLMERLTEDDSKIVRRSIWKEFRTFQWLPLTDTDRVWNTKKVTGPQWTHLPFDDNKPVVRIALNQTLVQDANRVWLFGNNSKDNSDECVANSDEFVAHSDDSDWGSDSDIEIVEENREHVSADDEGGSDMEIEIVEEYHAHA